MKLPSEHMGTLSESPSNDNRPGAQMELVAALAHELRSPLNAVLGLSEALLSTGAPFDPERTARYLGLIQSAGRKHLAQLDDLIDIARHDSGRLVLEAQPFDLGRLLTRSFEAAKAESSGKSLYCLVQSFPKPVLLVGDERLLGRALRHLIGRAFKASPASGRLQVGTLSSPESLTIVITDSGEQTGTDGFDALMRPRSGESPLQLGGTELGLTFAERAVRQHGGRITAKGNSAGGTTIAVSFPSSRIAP
jgi:cell cycle sensor histidine kinase DivJ